MRTASSSWWEGPGGLAAEDLVASGNRLRVVVPTLPHGNSLVVEADDILKMLSEVEPDPEVRESCGWN